MTGQTTLEYLVSRGDNICVIKKKNMRRTKRDDKFIITLLYIGMCMNMYIITFIMLRGERRRVSRFF